MSKLQEGLSQYWLKIQGSLFPWLSEEVGEGTAKRQQLVMILEVIRVEDHVPVTLGLVGATVVGSSGAGAGVCGEDGLHAAHDAGAAGSIGL